MRRSADLSMKPDDILARKTRPHPQESENYPPMFGNAGRLFRFMGWMRELRILCPDEPVPTPVHGRAPTRRYLTAGAALAKRARRSGSSGSTTRIHRQGGPPYRMDSARFTLRNHARCAAARGAGRRSAASLPVLTQAYPQAVRLRSVGK
jgi:hypothetical protein